MSTSPSRYRLLYEIGRGGMGSVDLAESPAGELVAVKRILPELARDERSRAMFLREARLLAKIAHPNVVGTVEVDAGDDETPAAIVMEFVDGISLKDAIEMSPEGLPVPIAAQVALGVAQGLHAAHELADGQGVSLGVVHRDVSPHNVLLTFDGGVKLLDFGVAKTSEGTRTNTGEVKGKVAYMAPEQAMADPVDRRSDIYALGALLWETLTGRRMHGTGTDLEILRRMATERPMRVRELRPDVPPELDALVASMTEEARDLRPTTADEVARALEPFAAGADAQTLAAWLRGIAPRAQNRQKERVESARSAQELTRVSRPVRPLWLVALVAVLATIGVTYGFSRRDRAPAQDPAASTSSASSPAPTPAPPASASADTHGDSALTQPPPRPAPPPPAKPRTAGPPPALSTPPPKVAPKVDEKPF